jgi:hypothetical protein
LSANIAKCVKGSSIAGMALSFLQAVLSASLLAYKNSIISKISGINIPENL